MNLTSPVTDNTWVNIILDARNNNMWKENAFVFKFDDHGCSIAKRYAENLMKVFFPGVKLSTPCVVPAKSYEISDTPLHFAITGVPVMVYGHYRYRLYMGYERKPAEVCVSAEGHIIPKTW
ncbi:uncharacterized protein LOC117639712 [Thrips palmi]|uniref:Uncharacterized protein LOC117639712 n=1 Tax=Thrips palmi TaxID=161013 RepID=A0A6P8YCI4_THRPL|nr:uncharacterized protein LOC117639712 [Thrips palmi]